MRHAAARRRASPTRFWDTVGRKRPKAGADR